MRTLARTAIAAVVLAGMGIWAPFAGLKSRSTILASAVAQDADGTAERVVDFDREVRPILSDRCFACHGPDEQRRRRGLRLDVAQGPFSDRGRYGGAVVVPGDSAGSLLYQRITHEDESRRMPRGSAVTPQSPLTDAQVETIALWIDQGAEWKPHWAFVAPERPELPGVGDADGAWTSNPTDAFVLDRLRREDLEPSEPADRTTLIRRLSYDLTGLPPTPNQIDAFLDDDAPDAYEHVVDRLLASPRYGERMAMRWLDLARYADTHGYHIDSHRDMWPWRDWVIDAYNQNLPFDAFTIDQLAGDLLPDATRDQLIATGFNRNHMINFEGGAIPEEYQVEYVVNRLDTTSTVWMGLTMACSRCHDHKFDPIRQRDFYRFFAFFNNVDEVGLDGQRGNAEPFAQVPTPSQDRARTALDAEIAAREAQLPEDEIASRRAVWEADALSTVATDSKAGLIAHFELDGHLADTSGHYRHAEASSEFLRYTGGRVGQAASFDGETRLELDPLNTGAFDLDGREPFSIAVWVRPASRLASYAPLSKVDADQEYRGYALSFDPSIVLPGTNMGSRLHFRLIHDWPDDALSIRTKDPLLMAADGIQAHEAWYHVAIVYDGSRRAAGLQFYLNGELLGDDAIDVEYDSLTGSTVTSAPLRAGTNLHVGEPPAEKGFSGQIDDLRFYDLQLTADEVARLAVDLPIRSIVSTDAEERTEPQVAELRDYFLSRHAPEALRTTWADLRDLLDDRAALDAVVTTTMVMHERGEPRETFILHRGDYRNQTDPVTPGTPAALPPMPPGAPANRLGLAKWLVDPSHPLTARVAMNRYWQMYFGTGLVKTAENFGTQGERPSHPALLDWLATEFVRSGWDVKAMQRLIVTSAAYRQSSKMTAWHRLNDPENRLLSRASRFRLPAEMIRDGALAASGLLNGEIGGPSVYPYQPAGLWAPMSYGAMFTSQLYTPSEGDDLYRRGMYSFWKRTVPPPALNAFDAPDREYCTVTRARTNTPLQALVLMNDPTFVEASRFLAERVIAEAGDDPADRIRLAYRLTTARLPEPAELDVLQAAASAQLAVYRADLEAALDLLSVGEGGYDPDLDPVELAAWANVASIILNLDESITRE